VVTFLSLLASALLAAALMTFLMAVSPDYDFATGLVGDAFGRIEMQNPRLKAAPGIATMCCLGSFLADFALACLACKAGEDDTLKKYPHQEVHVPPDHHVHLAHFALGGASALGIYSAVPTSLEMANASRPAGDSVWRNEDKPLGRFQQWHFLP
jgi:hypothetical protein